MKTVALLTLSNVFMTVAWYGHLRHKSSALWAVILVSWLIALPEYILQVPANRFGHGAFTAPQLKILQEIISITVFVFFCVTYLREPVRWNHAVAFGLILLAAAFALWEMPRVPGPAAEAAAQATPALAAPPEPS